MQENLRYSTTSWYHLIFGSLIAGQLLNASLVLLERMNVGLNDLGL
jgi:hypothetical protein